MEAEHNGQDALPQREDPGIEAASAVGGDPSAQEPADVTLSLEAAAVLAALPTAATPYLTCSRCNSITFINIHRVRPKNHEKDETKVHEYEQLPICSGCGSSKYLRAGVVSFQEKIEEEKLAIKEFEKKRVPATALIQRIARGFLGRVEYRRRQVERERYLRKIHRSATKIQTRVRGMQARRRTVIERCLRVIKTMHPSVLTFALAARPDRPPVFWYESPGERNIFFWNYREFVRRSGGRPTLIKVETNVLEITRRMLLREYALASRIQARWRGLTTRLVFREFKRQKGWLRGIQQSPAIRIQRLFRGHTSRKRCSALKVTTQYPAQLEAYRQSRSERDKHEKAKAFRSKLLGKYRLEYQVDKTSRMMALQVKPASVSSIAGAAKPTSKPSRATRKEEEVGPETHTHLQHSLKRAGAKESPSSSPMQAISHQLQDLDMLSSERDDSDEQRDPRNRHANSKRFAEIRRKLDMKKNLRGPRLHILKSQLYAPSPASPSK